MSPLIREVAEGTYRADTGAPGDPHYDGRYSVVQAELYKITADIPIGPRRPAE